METLKFKTNIKCLGCVAQVTPNMNETAGNGNWEVDVKAPEKVLTVKLSGDLKPSDIIKAVESAGYHAGPQS